MVLRYEWRCLAKLCAKKIIVWSKTVISSNCAAMFSSRFLKVLSFFDRVLRGKKRNSVFSRTWALLETFRIHEKRNKQIL